MSDLIVHIMGARPNFPKAAPVLRALDELGANQWLVHTGQHYDKPMSDVFFKQLGLPEPDVNLGVGSGSHARQTAAVMTALEAVLIEREPAMVVVYGDVNSTAAAALVASKMQVAIAHVEAGLRSFDRSMPEEINRLVTDRLSDLCFATSADAVTNLGNEGVDPAKIHLVGNPMIDTLLVNMDQFDAAAARAKHALDDSYVVATIHRPGNVDDADDALSIVKAMHAVADQVEIVLPLHPRGRQRLSDAGLLAHPQMNVIDPLGYTEFIGLMRGADAVITDSGGVQEETTILGIPCITLRPNTERPVTITHGTNQLTTHDQLAETVRSVLISNYSSQSQGPPPLWDGHAGMRIATILQGVLST